MDRESVLHRGITITRRGKRWVWALRHGGRKLWRSFADIDEAIDALDVVLNDRQRARGIENATGGFVFTIAHLLEDWFRWKQRDIAPATAQQ